MKNIIKKILKVIGVILLAILSFVILLLVYFNFPVFSVNNDAKLGVTFSQRYARDIGLDWKETYITMLDELKVRKIRIPVYWDLVEPKKDQFDYSEIDWQLDEANKRDAEVILAVGQKVPRWPECFIPSWVKDDAERKQELLSYIENTVVRYKNGNVVKYWQVENEPFLGFGICPAFDVNLLDEKIALVKKLDPTRKVIVTDSGELSTWVRAAKRADIFGTTMYLKIWSKKVGYFDYPIGPNFFKFKYLMNRLFANQKNAIVIELQGEPWVEGWTINAPLELQFSSLDEKRLSEHIVFARKVGFPEIYLWGVEWWYWLKVKMNHPELWERAKIEFAK